MLPGGVRKLYWHQLDRFDWTERKKVREGQHYEKLEEMRLRWAIMCLTRKGRQVAFVASEARCFAELRCQRGTQMVLDKRYAYSGVACRRKEMSETARMEYASLCRD